MPRLIDADALNAVIDSWNIENTLYTMKMNKTMCGFVTGIERVVTEIEKAETVDSEPVRHGKWIRDEFGARCSDCGLYAYRDKFDKPWESPYCPICGAKMDGERKEE